MVILSKREFYIALLVVILAFSLPFFGLFPQSTIYSDLIQFGTTATGITIILILNITILSIITFIFMYSRHIQKLENAERRDVSDDIFLIFWVIGWCIYALPLMFRPAGDAERIKLDFYLPFSIVSVLYIALLKISKIMHYVQIPYTEREKLQLFEFGTSREIIEILIIGAGSYFILELVSLVFPSPSSSGFLTREGLDNLAFMTFFSIPIEEMVFRGIVLTIIYWISFEIFTDLRKIKKEERGMENPTMNRIRSICWTIAIILQAMIFAVYHINRYGIEVWTLAYLIILAVITGIARKYAGLSACFIIHFLNNLEFSAIIAFLGAV